MPILTQETIGYINVFEDVTKTTVKDVIKTSELLFIVKEGDIARAIGRNGINIKRLGRLFRKKIRVVEYSKDAEKFVQNMIKPIESKVYKEDKNVIIELKNSHEKAIIIGKNKRNLKELNKTVKKYFDVNLMVK